MANAKKIGIIDIVVLGILVICLLFSIVGVSIDGWWTVKVDEDVEEYLGITQDDIDNLVSETGFSSIGDILDLVGTDEYKESIDELKEAIDNAEELGFDDEELDFYKETLGFYQKLPAICAFAIMTVLMLAIAVAVAVVKLFANNGILRIVLLAAAVAALLFAIIAAALTGSIFDFINDSILGEEVTEYVKPVLGAASALLLVGGLLGGVAGAVGFFLGKKKA